MLSNIYNEMCGEGIFMNKTLVKKLNALSEQELSERWYGIKALASRRKDLTNRAGWMAKLMFSDTALQVGKKVYQQYLAQERARHFEMQRNQEQAVEQQRIKRENEEKWSHWQRYTLEQKQELVRSYLNQCDKFYREYFCIAVLPSLEDVENLPRETVILWLGDAFPI